MSPRPTGVSKQGNAFADAIEPKQYARTPKAVYAALAYSFALRLAGDDHDAAILLLGMEWATLHGGGLIPQKPVLVTP